MGGRPTKLTEFTKEESYALIAAGNYRRVAAPASGIDISTFTRWMHNPRPEFQASRAAVDRAEADCETTVGKVLYDAAPTGPKVALELLSEISRPVAASKTC